jgi:endogenous inhibitor of DNA gyrase (YacG/DUF329 family)
MIRVRCPICAKSFEIAALDDLPSFPFCSARCRLVDLGRWADGKYAISEPADQQSSENNEDESAAEDAD